VLVRARSSEGIRSFTVGVDDEAGGSIDAETGYPFRHAGDEIVVVDDGTVQTYQVPIDAATRHLRWERLGLWVVAEQPGTFEILSIVVVPGEADYAGEKAGVRSVASGGVYRRTLYTHAPGRVQYSLRVPAAGRFDVDLGVVGYEVPVTFRVTAATAGGVAEVLLDHTHSESERVSHQTADLSHLAGQMVTLSLEANANRAGTVALWGAPTVSGERTEERPNVIFYVIDGASADYLSAYGYNRRTTPTLERLAAEGAVFEHAYSNADWTRPSTASFMTSLHHSVLGGFRGGFNVIPENAPTMAEHMHQAGYQTAVFTANPNAGSMSGLERGVDYFREDWDDVSYATGLGVKESSRYLHAEFGRWREQRPAQPYWVHFQTVDVHQEVPADPPFSGLFVSPAEVQQWRDWDERLRREGGHGIYSSAYEATGIDRVQFFTLHQGLHDENMAHNDYQLGRLVDRLKAEGEWENTLLVIGSDHGTNAAMDDMAIATLEDLPPRWSNPGFRPTYSRIPLILVWPGRIPGGQRIDETVSMIDVLPTILDLAGLPMPEVMQGQSLAPLLLGEEGWEPRPVIIEQFNADGFVPDEYSRIEIVDGRWGASLEIKPAPQPPPGALRPVPLLLYDLWNDPLCLHRLHEERPELVEHYSRLLEDRFAAHQALAQRFLPGGEVTLNPEQLRALHALGYIQ
jgi:arylsulfatase A-like enzyme